MSETLNTGPEPAQNQETEKGIIEEARLGKEKLKNYIETWRQGVKERARERWQSLLGTNLPHAENGHTIEPLPSEVPPVQQDEVIPSSYGNLPVDTIPEKPISLGTPEQQENNEPEKTQETPQNPTPAPRIITGAVPAREIQQPKLPKYIGPRPKTETQDATNTAPLPDFHTVQEGEGLYSIAKKYLKTVEELCSMNNISVDSTLHINQKIVLKPGVKIKPEPEKLSLIPDFHTVSAGETLYKISTQYDLPLEQLLQLNELHQNSILQIGQILILKPGIKVPEKKPQEEKNGAEGLTGKEYIIYKIDEYIQKRTKHTKIKCKINGKMILESAIKHEIPAEFLVAILVNDSNLGTKGKGATNNNPGNVGQTDEKDAQGITVEGYKTIEEGVDACAENLSRRIRAFQNSYPGTELDIGALVTNVGPDGKGFFLYEIGKNNPKKRGAYMTSPVGQKSVPRLTSSLRNDIYPNN